MRTFLGLPEGVRVRDSSITNTTVDASSCISACALGSDRYSMLNGCNCCMSWTRFRMFDWQ